MKQITHKVKVHLDPKDGHLFIHLPHELVEKWGIAAGDEVEYTIEHLAVFIAKVHK